MLLDDNPNFNERPTRQNMFQGFQWLIAGCQPGDSLFFHYSGKSFSIRIWIRGASSKASRLRVTFLQILLKIPLMPFICAKYSYTKIVMQSQVFLTWHDIDERVNKLLFAPAKINHQSPLGAIA